MVTKEWKRMRTCRCGKECDYMEFTTEGLCPDCVGNKRKDQEAHQIAENMEDYWSHLGKED